jgi:hypothetical protein
MTALDTSGAGKSPGPRRCAVRCQYQNLVLTVGAVASIAQTGLPGGQQAGVLAVVIVLGSVTVAASLVIYLAMGAKAAASWTARGRGWPATTRQSCWCSSSPFGVLLVGQGITGLS